MVKALFVLAALSVSSAAMAASESISKVDTGRGEVLLEMQATGIAQAKVVRVSTACNIRITATSEANAASIYEEKRMQMESAFQKAGLSPASLDFSAGRLLTGTDAIYVEADAAAINDPSGEAEKASDTLPRRNLSYSQLIGLNLASFKELQTARTVSSELGCDEEFRLQRRPDVQFSNADAAKSEATVNAINAAKQRAGVHAAALNMKVGRILRVSEVGQIQAFLGADADIFLSEIRKDRDFRTNMATELPISVSIMVDFVLSPK